VLAAKVLLLPLKKQAKPNLGTCTESNLSQQWANSRFLELVKIDILVYK